MAKLNKGNQTIIIAILLAAVVVYMIMNRPTPTKSVNVVAPARNWYGSGYFGDYGRRLVDRVIVVPGGGGLDVTPPLLK